MNTKMFIAFWLNISKVFLLLFLLFHHRLGFRLVQSSHDSRGKAFTARAGSASEHEWRKEKPCQPGKPLGRLAVPSWKITFDLKLQPA